MELLTPQQVADVLGISDRTVHKLCREGKLGYVQVDSKHRRFTSEDIQAYLESVRVHAKLSRRPQAKNVPPKLSPQPHSEKVSQNDIAVVDRASLRKEMKQW